MPKTTPIDEHHARLEQLARRYAELRSGRVSGLQQIWLGINQAIGRRAPAAPREISFAAFMIGDVARPSVPLSEDRRFEPYFEARTYLDRNPDIAAEAANDPLKHYVTTGSFQNRRAHPLFDPDYYVAENPEAAAYSGGVIRHYLALGRRLRLNPSAAFDARWYAVQANVPDGTEVIAHYLSDAADPRVSTHPLFDVEWYDAQAPGEGRPLLRYLARANRTDVAPNPFFDARFYLESYPDVAHSSFDPFLHYLQYGMYHRDPNAWFSTAYYLATNPDVAHLQSSPLLHFVNAGWREGRYASPFFDTAYYAKRYLAAQPDMNPLAHFLQSGRPSGNQTHEPISLRRHEPTAPPSSTTSERMIEISMSTAQGVEHAREAVRAILATSLPVGTRLVVLDDTSPADEISAFLDEIDDSRLSVELRANERSDLGYDRVTIDADVVVAHDWLLKLHAAAYSADDIAYVTPLSNDSDTPWHMNTADTLAAQAANVKLTDELAQRANPTVRYILSGKPGITCTYERTDISDGKNVLAADTYVYRNAFAAVRRSGNIRLADFFDSDYYLAMYPDIRDAGVDPLEHFVRLGSAENRRAHPLFDPDSYRIAYPDAETYPGGAIRHYLAIGSARRYNPSVVFDAARYARLAHLDRDEEVITHYATVGQDISPHELFDPEYYGEQRPRIDRAPLADYIAEGADHGANPHRLFNTAYYLAESPDVVAAGIHPFVHYLLHGQFERNPNAWFDTKFYLRENPDIAAARINPLAHYLRSGYREYRNPHPRFNTAYYLRRYLDEDLTQNPLIHYLSHGAAQKYTTSRFDDTSEFLATENGPTEAAVRPPIDIIVPVYRGVEETRACIESVLTSTLPDQTRLVIINDASPDADMAPYLASICDSRIVLLTNEENLGFVATVNRGMRLDEKRDVLLLNSDTLVSNDWLGRIANAAYRQSNIATVTPLSNNATICSFPTFCADNVLDESATAHIDAVTARVNAARQFDIPTAVGFCMYIRRATLAQIGLFDVEHFGKGYGEENDFCMRAAATGWRHVLTADTFVFHKGGVSFAGSADSAKTNATAVLTRLHPDYSALVARHVAEDPALGARFALASALIREADQPATLHLTHRLGGGIAKHVAVLSDRAPEAHAQLELSPLGSGAVRLRTIRGAYAIDMTLQGDAHVETLRMLIAELGVEALHIHHIFGYDLNVERLVARIGLPFEFTIHDYFSICPQITLTDEWGVYCGEPDEAGCNACIERRPPNPFRDIASWRDSHAWLVRDARAVNAPTNDVARRMAAYFPSAAIRTVPNE